VTVIAVNKSLTELAISRARHPPVAPQAIS